MHIQRLGVEAGLFVVDPAWRFGDRVRRWQQHPLETIAHLFLSLDADDTSVVRARIHVARTHGREGRSQQCGQMWIPSFNVFHVFSPFPSNH